MAGIEFGMQVAPVAGDSDRAAYREVVADAELAHDLGFEGIWLLEHHFSDYFPTPSPLLHMAHLAAHVPEISLGTSVLVLPWYQPIRLAEEIAMLAGLTDGLLHLGIGRGTARSEYRAYDVDMNEARGRFAECVAILDKALSGETFTHEGRFFTIPDPIRLRPEPARERIRFYGAIGSPASAEIMADLGLPPFCLSQFPDGLLVKILERWRARRGGAAANARLPISIKMFIAETDEEAREAARTWMPDFFALQADHYEVDADPWSEVEEYAAFSRMFANLRQQADPANLGGFCDMNLVGSAETIRARIARLAEIGFGYFMVSTTIPGMPQALRQEHYRRFAAEVMPHFAEAGGPGARDVA